MNVLAHTETKRANLLSPTQEKWGEAARAGFQTVPDLLLKHQNDLNISATEMVVLLNVLMHWWYLDQKPFPRSTTIARRMGVTIRTVQRALSNLQTAELLLRQKGPNDETYLDPSPLVERLGRYAKTDKNYLLRSGLQAMAD
jgi:hypothetical protein